MKRKAIAVAGIAALATFAIGGVALAADGADDDNRPGVAATGSPSPDDSSTTTAPAQPGGEVVPSDLAAAAALAHTGGGTVTRVESEFEHGRAVWKVRIVKNGVRYDVHVDTVTGQITRSESKGGGRGRGGRGSDD